MLRNWNLPVSIVIVIFNLSIVRNEENSDESEENSANMDEYESYAFEKGAANDTTGIIDANEGFQDDGKLQGFKMLRLEGSNSKTSFSNGRRNFGEPPRKSATSSPKIFDILFSTDGNTKVRNREVERVRQEIDIEISIQTDTGTNNNKTIRKKKEPH